jgi:putative ABC transport system permease protein
VERDLETEMRVHLDEQTAEYMRAGMSVADARSAAVQSLGCSTAYVKDECRASLGLRLLDESWTNVRHAVRLLTRTPTFTAASVLTVALAIAANTTIFSLVNAVLLRPLPFTHPDDLIQVTEKNDRLHLASFSASVLNFLSWREQTRAFQELAAIGFANYTLSGSGEPEQVSGNRLSPAVMRVLGLTPIAGRTFTDAEERPAAAPVAMIGEGLWKRRLGGDAGVIGRTVVVNDVPTTIVGIAPAPLRMFSGGEIYAPLTIDPAKEIRLNHTIVVVGRLRPHVSIGQAQAEMDTTAAHIGEQFPEVRDWGVRLISFFDTFVSAPLHTGLLVLLGAVLCVLLIACANIANLLLARAAARQKEIATRTALGASRGGLMAQLLIESLVLSVTGGIIGIVAAVWTVPAVVRALPPNLLPAPDVPIDRTVMAFATGLTALTGLLFGLAPAWRASRADVHAALKEAGRAGGDGLRRGMRTALAATELALATLLLVAAGLLIRTLVNLQRVPLGFEPHGVITFQLAPPPNRYALTSTAPLFYRSLITALQSIPGVRLAAVSSGVPFGAGNYTTHPMLTAGASVLPPGTLVPIDWRIVSPDYFATMGVPLVRGRTFTDADGPTAAPVVIVSQATAQRFWGDVDPIGRTLIRSADRNTTFTVIGVVGDVRSTALTQESLALYYPVATRAWPLMDIVVQGTAGPEAVLPTIRRVVHDLDPQLALANVRTMDEWVAASAAQPRFDTALLVAFAALAVIIAAVGIYGVLAYSVSQRTREIGVRLALGAEPAAVLRLVVGEGMRVGFTGIAVGLVAAFMLSRAIASLVYGVPTRDPMTYAGVTGVLLAVALIACVLPARRASRVDPIIALHCE